MLDARIVPRNLVDMKLFRIIVHITRNLVVLDIRRRAGRIRIVFELSSAHFTARLTAIVVVGTLFDSVQYTGLAGLNCSRSSRAGSCSTRAPRRPSTGVNAPVAGGLVGIASLVVSGRQFQIPPACGWRSYTVTSKPASTRCRAAGVPPGPEPITATVRILLGKV
jgi:hypothetical protein